MEQGKDRRNWVTCGIGLLIVACIVTLVLGGGTAVWARISSFGTATPSAGAVDVDVPQTTVTPVAQSENPTSTPLQKEIPFEAVVQIQALYLENGRYEIGWTGSGSIISPDGLILTNAHVVLPDRYFDIDALGIAITIEEDRPPVVRYFAEVFQANEELDIAVLRIVSDTGGNPIDPASLNLPYVELGDADTLTLGDEIAILGYPGIGGETITLTRGEVSGFTAEPGRGDRAFIKTSATIAGGNSGGLAADANGRLIGIPTQLGYGGDDEFVDCRVLADTNRDGLINEEDNCIPTGGFINALRPINLALPLIEAAKEGQIAITGADAPPPLDMNIPDPGQVLFQDDFQSSGTGWREISDSYGSMGYLSGEYIIRVSNEKDFQWSEIEMNLTDVVISVDARVLTSVGDGDYGVMCRYQDPENFYAMEISEDGYFAIWKYQGGEYFPLVDWRASGQVPRHSGPRTITVACVGEKLALAIDGEVIAEVRDGAFSEGGFALMVGTWENGGFAVAFDNMIITAPE